MEIQTQPRLRFHGVDIVNLSFTSIKMPNFSNENEIEVNIEPKVFFPKDDPVFFNILMRVNANLTECFELSLLAIGNFELNSTDLDATVKKSFINNNAPAIMFPYVRSFITTFTANLGRTTGSLIIPTKFFKGELEEYVLPELS